MNKILAHFGDALCKKFIFFIARGVQFDNEVHPPQVCASEGVERYWCKRSFRKPSI